MWKSFKAPGLECPGPETEARSCNDFKCSAGVSGYTDGGFINTGNGDSLDKYLGKYDLGPPDLPGTSLQNISI